MTTLLIINYLLVDILLTIDCIKLCKVTNADKGFTITSTIMVALFFPVLLLILSAALLRKKNEKDETIEETDVQ